MVKFKYILFFVFIAFACHNADPEKQVVTGAAHLVNNQFDILKGKKVGLVTNHSAIVGDSLLIDVLYNAKGVDLKALFSPEHGIRGDADAGAHIQDSTDKETGIPIYSLYGETRKPTPEMLNDIDVLVFDIQDVGARFYTYIATMGYTMQAAAEQGIPYVVLDRPNPLGGKHIEGFVPPRDYETFNGLYPIPVTHGMTVGEFAKMIKGEALLKGLGTLDLQVVKMQRWTRDMLWPDTGLPWQPPSPNIPDFETALVYPGACLFEATRMSEGRGTREPFILLGAPWAAGAELAQKLNNKELPGLTFKATSFTPESIEGMSTNPKLEGEKLEGIRYGVADPQAVEPLAAGVHVLRAFYDAAPDSVKDNFFRAARLNTLAGSDQFYNMIKNGKSAEEIIDSSEKEVASFLEQRKMYLLYE